MTAPLRPPWATLYTDIESRLGESLADLLKARRAKGIAWRRIANEITSRTGIDITGETLRVWHRQGRAPVGAGEVSAA